MNFEQLNWRELEVALNEAKNQSVESLFRAAAVLTRAATELLEKGNQRIAQKED